MTVVPIPVAPPTRERATQDTSSGNEAAPGFASLLTGARGETGAAAQETQTPAAEEQPAGALTDGTVMALLAALAGVVPQPAAPVTPGILDPAATDVTDATAAPPTAAGAGEITAATIALVADGDAAAPDPNPAATTPQPPVTPDDSAPRPDAAPVAVPVAPVVEMPALAVPVDAPAPRAEPTAKPASNAADAFTALAPTTVAPREATTAAANAASVPAAPPTPAAPVEQLVTVLRPLRRSPDGTYELHLQLRPAELGQVDLKVELRNGVLHAAIRTENPHAAEIVRDSLSELRARLDAEGVHAGALTVDHNASQSAHRDRQSHTGDRGNDVPFAAADAVTVPTLPATNADALLDVRI